jgi:hypothetical protein
MDESVASTRDARIVWGTYAAAAVLLVLAWEPIVLGRIATDHENAFDLGLYSQAVYRLSWSDPNPWLTIRQCGIFNDHFEPILCIAAPLAKLIEPAFAGPLIELLFVLASPLSVIWLWRRGLLSASVAAVAIAYMLHNRGTVSAILFPFHPTTWAIFPSAWLAATVLADRRRGVFLSLLVLFCCKQEFPLMGLMAAVVYALRRQFRFALVLAAFSTAWLLGVVWLRPLLLGPVQDYVSARLLAPEGLWASIERGWRGFDVQAVARLVLPLLPLAVLTIWRRQRPAFWLWLLLVPPLGLRFLGRAWMFHYMPPLVPLLVLGLVPLGSQARLPHAVVVAVFALLLAVNAGFWTRSAAFLVRDDPQDSRPWRADRLASIERGRCFLKSHPDGEALVQGNLIPRLVTRPDIFLVASVHNPAAHTFRYVFIEQPPSGDPWPATTADYERLLAQWRRAAEARVIIDDEHVFLAEGAFRDLPRQ